MGRKPCCDKLGVKKGPWTVEEDRKLVDFMLTNGQCCWRVVPKLAGLLRCGKSCRLRWTNYLRPDLKRGLLNEAEQQLVIDLHARIGNRWSRIAGRMPGRTDNEIKNQWNTHIKKKLLKMGIDPTTHKPIIKNSSEEEGSRASPPSKPGEEDRNSTYNSNCSQSQSKDQEMRQGTDHMVGVLLEDHEDSSSSYKTNEEQKGFEWIDSINDIPLLNVDESWSTGTADGIFNWDDDYDWLIDYMEFGGGAYDDDDHHQDQLSLENLFGR